MPELATAPAPVQNFSEPIKRMPQPNTAARWMMIACAEVLSVFTRLERVGSDPLLLGF